MSALTTLKGLFKQQKLASSAKALSKQNLQVFSLEKAIKEFSLDIYSGMDADDLANNPETAIKAFTENNLVNLDKQYALINYDNGTNNFTISQLYQNTTKMLLEREGLIANQLKITPYIDTDKYLADELSKHRIHVIAIQTGKDKFTYLLYFAKLPLPTLTDFIELKRLGELDNPSEEDQKKYQKLYQDIKAKYQDNKSYFVGRENAEIHRQLESEESRHFLRIYNYLQTSF